VRLLNSITRNSVEIQDLFSFEVLQNIDKQEELIYCSLPEVTYTLTKTEA